MPTTSHSADPAPLTDEYIATRITRLRRLGGDTTAAEQAELSALLELHSRRAVDAASLAPEGAQ